MPVQEDYRVALDAFHGPLDLLLFLIRRAEVDVTDIPVAEIADQYLVFLREIDEIDVEVAGEFLVMAATLIELKSRTLAPEAQPTDESEGTSRSRSIEDPRVELVQQLLAYQRFRIASESLDEHRHAHEARAPLRPGRPYVEEDAEDAIELEDAHALDLAEAYERIMSSIDMSRLGDHVVEMDDTPIRLHEEDLLDRLRHGDDGRLSLQSAFDGHTRQQRIGLFLATLELVRQRRVTVIQDALDDAIELVLRDVDDETLVIEADALDGA